MEELSGVLEQKESVLESKEQLSALVDEKDEIIENLRSQIEEQNKLKYENESQRSGSPPGTTIRLDYIKTVILRYVG